MLDKLKANFLLVVIGILVLIVLWQAFTRPDVSTLERDKKQLTADLDATRKAGQSAIKQLDKLKEGLQSTQNTANAIGTGLDTGESITTESGKLLSRLAGIIRSIPEKCVCGDKRP